MASTHTGDSAVIDLHSAKKDCTAVPDSKAMGPKRSVDELLVFAAIFSRKARTKFVLPVLVLGILMRNKVHSQLILGTQNEKCPSGNCTGGPAHKCGLVPKTTWLGKYVSPILKVCHCENLTMAGPYCDKECPHGRSNPCNGHGECIYSTATCACDFGWQGALTCVVLALFLCSQIRACRSRASRSLLLLTFAEMQV